MERRMRVISLLNLKGGVAKTFTAVNMAYELYRRGYHVLLLDNDKQGNLSKAYGRYNAEQIAPVTKLLSGNWECHGEFIGGCNKLIRMTDYGCNELIQATDYDRIDIISSNMSLFGATWNLTKEDGENQIWRYKKLMDLPAVNGCYDYCIIDNPPDVGLNVINALAVSDEVIIPVKIDEDALEGLDIVAEQIEEAKAFNDNLFIQGILVTVFQGTDGETAGLEWLKQESKYDVLGVVRYSKKVSENSFMRKPIYEYSPCCGAAQDYKRFITDYTGMGR